MPTREEHPRFMYTRDRMERNLVMGNIAEALFRFWFETRYSDSHIVLSQFGYNPEGIVSEATKALELKGNPNSPDFALFERDYLNTKRERPLLGISVNSQYGFYSMDQARLPKLCYKCERKDACYEGRAKNIWHNLYNIKNDYKLFYKIFKTDVILVTLISKPLRYVFKKLRETPQWQEGIYQFIKRGPEALENGVVQDAMRYLLFQRGKGPLRQFELYWIIYSDILNGKIPYSTAGAPVNRGQPRLVACIDSKYYYNEIDLENFLRENFGLVPTHTSLL